MRACVRTSSKPGESIAKIAEAAYGSQNYWPYIIRANPGIVAEKIRPGMTINLPAESDVKDPAASGATASTAGATAKADHRHQARHHFAEAGSANTIRSPIRRQPGQDRDEALRQQRQVAGDL